jgi:acyl-CoA synthetase (AMP-forming)/AMP-acid ligase II
VFDADGLRIMIDRYKDIVKSGGENVSSLRGEAALHQHPAVQKAAVVGLPHERWGVAVTAIVVLAPDQAAPARHDLEQRDQAVLAQDILQFCRERLAGFETPKRVVFAAQLPETVGGKVLRYKLRGTYRDLYR